jgi:hypothetical protein
VSPNDRSLIRQMITAGKYSAVIDFMPDYNLQKSKEIIEKMGDKWCCHPKNAVKKLEVPLEILKQNQSKFLKRK